MLLISFAWLLAGGLALLLTVLGAECWLALLPRRLSPTAEAGPVAVLIPAHNEAAGIRHTLLGVQSQLRPGDRIVVVADNCSDATATIVREAGVEVVERFHDTLRGKGFALDAGVRYLETNSPPDIVVILDADCELETRSLADLAAICASVQRPVQARYLMRVHQDSGPATVVSAFAFLLKNWVRARGLSFLRLPSILAGTGMAFPWRTVVDAPLGSSEIVEDLAIGLHFAREGNGAVFFDEACVWSDLPNDPKIAITQRTRWEHGYLSSILQAVPGLVVDAFRRARFSLLLVALDLMVPPLALLAIVSMLACAVLGLIAHWSESWGPLILLLAAGVFAALGIAVAWVRFARELIPARVLFAIPGYVLSKLNIYRRFVTHRQKEWVRTKRT